MKVCSSCQETKLFTEFHKSANTKSGYHSYCKPCVRTKNQKWVADNKKKQAQSCANWYSKNKARANLNATKWHYKKHYGITYHEFLQLANNQNNQCKICSVILTFDKVKNNTRAVLDHCHETQKIRGILCNSCNVGLGAFRDNLEALHKAIHYLEN